MNPYSKPGEIKIGAKRPRIQHLPPDACEQRSRRERQMEKLAVAAERRAIKKSARRHLKKQMNSEIADASS